MFCGVLANHFRSWQSLQLTVTSLFFTMFIYLFFIPESVRWQIARGKLNMAKCGLDRLARMNGKPNQDIDLSKCKSRSLTRVGIFQTFFLPGLRSRLAIIALNWLVTSITYYGISLNATLHKDLYMNFILKAACQIPSYLFCMILAERLGRRFLLAICQVNS